MRLALTGLLFLGLLSAACSVSEVVTEPPPDDEPTLLEPPSPSRRPPPPSEPPKPLAPPPAVDDGSFAEVVYVLMRDRKFDLWFCTGTLVAKDRVVTAAHCLDPRMFIAYEIVAPLAPSRPSVSASNPTLFGGDFELVENPDIGFLTLDTPITLPRYAQLTDVVARVESGEALTAAAMVRTKEEPEAPLAMSQHLPLTSTVQLGYVYGFGTPYFSKGGDSGAGLFLVEDGEPTHKLVGVARQPEPDRDLDHFTRIGAPFLDWYDAVSPNL
ncbi:MAG: trypsin-like serine protease [Labilithrix sp.]|nr:trypsin-like serine protease [Labilithrix sp.]